MNAVPTIDLNDGRTLSTFVEQSLGNLARPLSDRQLDDKFRDQAVLALPAVDVESLIRLCWRIDELDEVNELVTAAVPAAARVIPASRRA